MSTLIAIFGLVSMPFFLISLLAMGVQFIRKKDMRAPGICVIASFVIFIVCFSVTVSSDSTSALDESEFAENDTYKELETTTVEETITVEEITTQAETEKIPETTTEAETKVAVTESEDEFKASCKDIGYKKLLRTPEDYIGHRIVLTAKVQQIIDGGIFDDRKYYRIETDNDGSGYYYDDEYCMYDMRVNDDMKILEGDVLKIYGEFAGLETMKRVITGSKDEVPTVNVYYIELISE